MTIQSFNARLRKLNPYLRLRTRVGWVLLKAEGFAMAAVHRRGGGSSMTATIAGPIPYHTRGTVWRLERLPGQRKPLKYIHARMRRGRYQMIRMIHGRRGIKHRWQIQFMMI